MMQESVVCTFTFSPPCIIEQLSQRWRREAWKWTSVSITIVVIIITIAPCTPVPRLRDSPPSACQHPPPPHTHTFFLCTPTPTPTYPTHAHDSEVNACRIQDALSSGAANKIVHTCTITTRDIEEKRARSRYLLRYP